MCSVGDSGPGSRLAVAETIFQNGKTNKQKPLANVVNETDDNLPFIYTAVAFLENSELVKAMQKLLCIFI